MMKIEYFTENGKGTVTLNLDELLPCTQKKFKLILDMCKMSEKCYDHVSFLYDYIAGKIDLLKDDRSKLDENNAFDKHIISKINAEMKRWLALSTLISKDYGFDEITDNDATIKMKKSNFYAIKDDSIIKVEGWTFEKGGFIFEVYKDKRGYRVLLSGTGLAVLSTPVKQKMDVAVSIDSKLIDTLKKSESAIDGAKKLFAEKMVAAGFWTPEQETEHTKDTEIEPKATQVPDVAEVATVPARNTVASWTMRRVIIYRAFGKSKLANIADCIEKMYKHHIYNFIQINVYLPSILEKSKNSGKYRDCGILPNPPPFLCCGCST